MGDTTLTIDETIKELLKDHRVPAHDSWGSTLYGMMKVLPTPEEVRAELEGHPHKEWRGTLEKTGGVIKFFYHDEMDVYGSAYFPDVDALIEHEDQMDAQFPREPDEVTVGGDEEIAATFGDATFYFEEGPGEVTIDVPGAFSGSDSHGGEYDYIGEPVYIHNQGEVVQKGVVDDIIHEDAVTGIKLGNDHATEMLNHPDDQKREEYKEQHVEWIEGRCKSCGTSLRFPDTEEECPECGSVLTEDSVWPPDPLDQFEVGDNIVTSERETAMEIVRVGVGRPLDRLRSREPPRRLHHPVESARADHDAEEWGRRNDRD